MQIDTFGTLPDGQIVKAITLRGGGLTARVLTYGATIQDLRLDGVAHSMVLGAPELEPYLGPMTYFGAMVGRFANRIANGRFEIDGNMYQVPCNWIGKHALHGGSVGSGQRIWDIASLEGDAVRLTLRMSDGEMGFPGTLEVTLEIRLSDRGRMEFVTTAISDCTTPCSFAHHGYFNLSGGDTITEHRLRIDANRYLPVDDALIPTGEIRDLSDSQFDFRKTAPIGTRGLDHNFCLNAEGAMRPVAWLSSLESGTTLTVETDQPGLQVYDGAYIPVEGLPGIDGRIYGPYAGIALETQHWPDAPNQSAFPDSLLYPGQRYLHRVAYCFERNADF